MSILQDLDPKYAKIQSHTNTPTKKLFALATIMLLVVFFTLWLFFAPRTGRPGTGRDTLEESNKSQSKVTVEQATKATQGDYQPTPVAAGAASEPTISAANPETAAIRVAATQVSATPDNSLTEQSINENLAANSQLHTSLANSDSQSELPNTQKKVKSRTKDIPAKQKKVSRDTTQALAPTNSRMQAKSKDVTERDIEIISAIVR